MTDRVSPPPSLQQRLRRLESWDTSMLLHVTPTRAPTSRRLPPPLHRPAQQTPPSVPTPPAQTPPRCELPPRPPPPCARREKGIRSVRRCPQGSATSTVAMRLIPVVSSFSESESLQSLLECRLATAAIVLELDAPADGNLGAPSHRVGCACPAPSSLAVVSEPGALGVFVVALAPCPACLIRPACAPSSCGSASTSKSSFGTGRIPHTTDISTPPAMTPAHITEAGVSTSETGAFRGWTRAQTSVRRSRRRWRSRSGMGASP
eukprot:scaffold4496_cov128-Isochrysis_galbana.AAC.2